MTIRVGIVGMGGMGWFHASRYFQIPGVALTAIADIRPDRLEASNAVQINIEDPMDRPDLSSVERFADGDDLLAEADVDLVDICLPSYLHKDYTIRSLESSRHVLCEKPMALNVADANAMLAAARQSGRKLMIAQCIRFWPEYRYLKQVIQGGSLGPLLSLNLYRIGGRPSAWGWQNWFLDPARSGGSLYDLHIHDVDFVNSLFGAPDQIMASGKRASPESACEVIYATFRYASGPQVSIHSGWSEVQIPFKAGYEAWFQKGFLRLDTDKSPALTFFEDPERVCGQPADYPPGDAYMNEIQYFIRCIQDNRDPLECPPESARDSLALLARERACIDQEERA